jgi:hypothetical protein
MGIAVEGDSLFVANRGKGTTKSTIGEYDATTGMRIGNGPLVKTGLNNPIGIAVDQGDLFVVNHTGGRNGFGTIGEYDATTGMPIATTLVSGLSGPTGIAIVTASVPDASSTWTLLLLSLAAMPGFKALLRRTM